MEDNNRQNKNGYGSSDSGYEGYTYGNKDEDKNKSSQSEPKTDEFNQNPCGNDQNYTGQSGNSQYGQSQNSYGQYGGNGQSNHSESQSSWQSGQTGSSDSQSSWQSGQTGSSYSQSSWQSGRTGYGYPPVNNPYGNQYNMYQKPAGNGFAIASLVCGIIGLVFCCCGGIPGIVLGALAIVLALVSRSKNENKKMQGVAIAGIICGAVSFILGSVELAVMIFDDTEQYFTEIYEEYDRILNDTYYGQYDT